MGRFDQETSGDRVPIALLEREWETLRRRIPADRYHSWADAQPVLRRFPNAAAVVQFLHDDSASRGNAGNKDAVLCALLALARDDALAGRVVLQALLPGLKQLARRTLFESSERETFWELLLAHTWSRIRSYPLASRPRSVAANLLFDSLQRTLRELSRERRQRRRHDGGLNESPSVSGLDQPELVLRDAVHAGAITTAEARLIFVVRLERRPLADAATEQGIDYNVARVRLQRAERRLLVHLGLRPVPKRRANAPSSTARASRAGTAD